MRYAVARLRGLREGVVVNPAPSESPRVTNVSSGGGARGPTARPDFPKALACLEALGINPWKPGREYEQRKMAQDAVYLLQRLGVDLGYEFPGLK